MTILNYGHRLAILKAAWNFPVNQTLADYISGDTEALSSGNKRLNPATISRWLGEKGGKARDYPEEQTVSGLADFFEAEGYLKDRETTKAAVIAAMKGDDVEFAKFVAGAANDPLPVPSGVRNINGNGNLRTTAIVGRYCLYRLGIEAERFGRVVILNGKEKKVLRRVPVEVTGSATGFLTWRELYNGNKSKGFVMVLDQYITVWGEDDNIQGYSELFLAQLSPTLNKKGFYEGVIAMDGDVGRPTAYKVLLRRVSDEDNNLSWEEFAEKYQDEIELKDIAGDGVLEAVEDDVESEFNTKYTDYIKSLQIKPSLIDLQN
jgi:hypothetical protein